MKSYVDSQVSSSTLLFAADSDTAGITADDKTVELGGDEPETLNLVGTSNEIETLVSADNTVKIGLPDSVSITSDLTVGGDINLGTSGILGNSDEMVISANGTDTSAAPSGSESGALTLQASGIYTDASVDMDSTLNVQGVATLQAGYEMDHLKKDEFSISPSDATATEAVSFAHADYKSAKIVVSSSDGTEFCAKELLIVTNGTAAKIVEYGTVHSTATTADQVTNTWTAEIDGANVVVKCTMGADGGTSKGGFELIK